jgi:hypothetical protein
LVKVVEEEKQDEPQMLKDEFHSLVHIKMETKNKPSEQF